MNTLAHSIDACTRSAAKRRTRRQSGHWLSIFIIVASVGLLAITGVMQ